MKTILITGVNGFVGSHLAAHLARRGFRILGSTSSEEGLRAATAGVEHKVVLRLGAPCDPGMLRGVDTVIHCAWDLHPGAGKGNIAGTRRLVETAEAARATQQVFISTNSAHPAAVTEYGKSKLTVQRYVLERGHTALRLGLAIGPGGLFKRLSETLTQHRLVPLVNGGRGKVPIIAIEDFQQAVGAMVERRLTGLFNMFNPDLIPLRDVLIEIRAVAQRRTLLIPVPSSLLLGPAWVAGKLGIRLPIDVDNLRAFRVNLGVPERSDLMAFVPQPMTLREMVRAAAQPSPRK